MKMIVTLFTVLFGMTAFAGFGAYNGTTNLGVVGYVKCSTGLTCTKVADKLQIVSNGGASQSQVLATATTITAAQCGSTFYNSGAVVMKLPKASGVVGCRFTFVTANASNFDIDPFDALDQILVLTNAVGDAIRNATLGNSITLQAINSTQWVQISAIGTYTDIN